MTITEYGSPAGQVKLQPGDVVQLDGGEHVVDMVNQTRARCVPLATKHVKVTTVEGETVGFDRRGSTKNISTEVGKHLLIERRGPEWLAEWQAGRKAKKKDPTSLKPSQVRLEPGDEIMEGGVWWTVTDAIGDGCVLSHIDGRQLRHERVVNEFFLPGDGRERKDEAGRAVHLEQFLKLRQPPQPLESTNGSGDNGKETSMPRAKTKKAAQRAKVTKSKSRPATKAAAAVEKTNGDKKGKPFGHSAVRVVARLGKEGAEPDKIEQVLHSMGVKIARSTLLQNYRLGKAGKLEGAVLTPDQLALFAK